MKSKYDINFSIEIAQSLEARDKLDKKWESFISTAKIKDNKFIEPAVPFRDDVSLSEFNSVYKSIYDKKKFLS
jgi:hypothetical protein